MYFLWDQAVLVRVVDEMGKDNKPTPPDGGSPVSMLYLHIVRKHLKLHWVASFWLQDNHPTTKLGPIQATKFMLVVLLKLTNYGVVLSDMKVTLTWDRPV